MKIVLAEADRAVIAAVAAAAEPPGSIVRDFDTLLDFVGENGMPVSPKEYDLGIARLAELNSRLTHPTPTGLSRGRQISYPHIDGLHLLLLVSKLGKLDRSRPTARLVLDSGLLATWRLLNPIERYFALLERWWSLSEIHQGHGELEALRQTEYRHAFLRSQRQGNSRDEREHGTRGIWWRLVGMKQIALLQMFGMLDIVSLRAEPGEGWKIRRMRSTPWGLTASASYLQAFRYTSVGALEEWLDSSDAETDEDDASEGTETQTAEDDRPAFHYWADAVLPLFPAWQHVLGEPAAEEPFRGSCTLKVSLGEHAWRRIVLPAESTFDDLALFVLQAFKFDDEHLYEFRFRDQYAARRTLSDSRYNEAEDEYADALTLGAAHLFARQFIELQYGFGSEWRFQLLVEALDASTSVTSPVVLESQGRAPRQYD